MDPMDKPLGSLAEAPICSESNVQLSTCMIAQS